jgi:disulfide bond formation protein DsbB
MAFCTAIIIVGLFGCLVSIRHIWLEYDSFAIFTGQLPNVFSEQFNDLFFRYLNCSDCVVSASWKILLISQAFWTLILFIINTIIATVQMHKEVL